MQCLNFTNPITQYSFVVLVFTTRENLKDRRDFDNSPLKRCSKEAQDFVKSLLRTEPARRLTPDEALEHPWFKSKISSRNVELSNDVLESLAKEESEGEFKRIACSVSGRHLVCGLCTACYIVLLTDSLIRRSLPISQVRTKSPKFASCLRVLIPITVAISRMSSLPLG
jgi:serine/threonine protein kinase